MSKFTSLHLYLGAKVLTPEGVGTMVEYDIRTRRTIVQYDCTEDEAIIYPPVLKLILRPLTDLTEKERDEIFKLNKNQTVEELVEVLNDDLLLYPEEFLPLLSSHFDLFNLIPSGQALDATKMETNPYKP